MSFHRSVPTRKSGFLFALALVALGASFWYPWAIGVSVGLLVFAYLVEVVSRSFVLKDAQAWHKASASAQTAKMTAIGELDRKSREYARLTREVLEVQRQHEATVQARRNELAGLIVSLEAADKSAFEVIESLLSPMKPETAERRIQAWQTNTGRYGPAVVASLRAKVAKAARVPV